MNCKIVFTDTAKSDLQKIAFYIADLTKDKQKAIQFVKGFFPVIICKASVYQYHYPYLVA